MMAAQLRGEGDPQGLGQKIKDTLDWSSTGPEEEEKPKEREPMQNRAGESKSPYVRSHKMNPVAWQLWGAETIELARKENKLVFVSIGYSACHWCHVMERESFENDEIATILNESFIPIKVDREERPDLDRIYMDFVQATAGTGGWPLNVFITPDMEPVFGGTYWPGPSHKSNRSEDTVNFLGVLQKLSTAWKEQEDKCRLDAKQIMGQLKGFSAEGTFGHRLDEGGDGGGLDIELLEEVYQNFAGTFDTKNGGFGLSPKFPTPSKLSFLLRLGKYPQPVLDVVGIPEVDIAANMAITTLRKMARGGIHDHIGNGFARYSVTADWSLPHFEKMLYDNAQLLHVYLDAFLLSRDAELLGVVYDVAIYLTTTLSHGEGGFYSSEDSDSFYRKGDAEKREGAFYVWTKREFQNVLGTQAEPILSAFFNVSGHGNVEPENDLRDEFLDQNVLAVVCNPSTLASTFGMKEVEIVKIIKDGKAALRAYREKERIRPALDDKIVVSWNGIAIGALARVSAVTNGFDPKNSKLFMDAALKAATFIKNNLYDEDAKVLYRIYFEGRGDTKGFADDYAYLIEGLIDLYEATFDEAWLHWAEDLQKTQIELFYDTGGSGAFFSTAAGATDVILRLKDGMDTSEPSTNGISASNNHRLSSFLNDSSYTTIARETITSFESEVLQYPWLYASFMPSIVASNLGIKGVVVFSHERGEDTTINSSYDDSGENIKAFERQPRGALTTFMKLTGENKWLRERNGLVKDFRTIGKTRMMVCENGTCSEEGVSETAVEGEVDAAPTA
ncbi:hypothetical protein BJ878DRAFT_88074 [Calycina marina]|uniref:Spermatogenesis-associated protein 20-like TRX domain-containing protein n=1 Tax=Calycina marina TaxID=1763456 RepID=A0A9P7Z2F8_9HELO|nr:hypothetical protein BJ878DRAFT_88074 [Calycina marina]